MTATTVKERPILFSGPMVRAILDGSKTQTRRIVKPQPDHVENDVASVWQDKPAGNTTLKEIYCPYGRVGDRLWVRESFWTYTKPITAWLLREGADTWPMVGDMPIAYDADGDQDV